MVFTPDPLILPIARALRDCLCNTLTARGLGDNCSCELLAGSLEEGVPPPKMGHSFAWVGIVNAFPYQVFAEPTAATIDTGHLVGANMVMGVARCYAVDREGEIRNQEEAFEKQMADMAAMRAAFMCCEAAEDMALGEYVASGPESGVVIGTWTLQVGVPL